MPKDKDPFRNNFYPIKKNEMPESADKRYSEWNARHGKDPWVITNIKPSTNDSAELQSRLRHPSQQFEVINEHPPRKGVVIYLPHECPTPPIEEYPVGTIWECNEYHDKTGHGYRKVCYDQWILERVGRTAAWVLFKRALG